MRKEGRRIGEHNYGCSLQDVLGYKVDVSVVQFIMSILDYVAADILKVGVALVGVALVYHSFTTPLSHLVGWNICQEHSHPLHDYC